MRSSDLALAARRKAAALGRARIEENRRRRRERWKAEAPVLWDLWQDDPLFTLGVGLYWGEGDKSTLARRLALSNSDVNVLRTWLRWCHRFLPGVPLAYQIQIHDNCDLDAALQFWKRELGIDIHMVSTAVSCASKRKRSPKTLPNGTVRVMVGRGSVEWFTKMMVWLELAQGL